MNPRREISPDFPQVATALFDAAGLPKLDVEVLRKQKGKNFI